MKQYLLNNNYLALEILFLDKPCLKGEVIILCCIMNNKEKLLKMLETCYDYINYQDELYKNTALHYVTADKYISREITEILLKNGAKINIQNKFGLSPFFNAVIEHQPLSYLSILLKYGADINQKNIYGFTPLLYMCSEGTYTQLYFTFMIHYGANPYLCNEDGISCLNIDRLQGNLNIIKCLNV